MRTSYRRDLTLQRPAPKKTHRIVLALAAAGAIALGASFLSTPAAASPETEAFVQQTVDEGYQILNGNSADKSTAFRDFMLSLTDMRRIATFTLGQYANRASEQEVNDFVDAFTEFATTVYEVRLGQYTGQTMRVVSSNDRAADDSVVNAVVVNPVQPNAPQINAAFRVRTNAGGGYIITDMQVEGVWLAINQRADFTSFLQQNNGSLPALSASLRQQAQQLRR